MTARPDGILFTGFGAFGSVVDNPSAHVARAAAEAIGASFELLPVTYEVAARIAHETTHRHVVHFGVATNRGWIGLERRAKNARGADVGERRKGPDKLERVTPDLPSELESTFPLERLEGAIARRWSGDVRLSDDAGAFVCNATLLHALAVDPQRFFVHVPSFSRDEAEAFGRAFAEAYVEVLASSED